MSEKKDDTDKLEEQSKRNDIKTGNVENSKGVAVGEGATAIVVENLHLDSAAVTEDSNGDASKKRAPTWVVAMATILVLAAVAFAIYWIFLRPCSWNDPEINALDPTNTNVTVNETTWIRADATDKEDDPLTYNWSTNRGKVPGGNPGELIQYTAPSMPGTDTVRVTVSDGKGGICKESITLSIQNAP